jgi:hypothetical protein
VRVQIVIPDAGSWPNARQQLFFFDRVAARLRESAQDFERAATQRNTLAIFCQHAPVKVHRYGPNATVASFIAGSFRIQNNSDQTQGP